MESWILDANPYRTIHLVCAGPDLQLSTLYIFITLHLHNSSLFILDHSSPFSLPSSLFPLPSSLFRASAHFG